VVVLHRRNTGYDSAVGDACPPFNNTKNYFEFHQVSGARELPELPEVETVANALRPHLIERRITRIDTFTNTLRNPLDIQDRDEILGSKITSVRRRAKYILVDLRNLNTIVVHLGMTGICRVEHFSDPLRRHDHVVWYLDDGMSWRFNDPRKFGIIQVYSLERPGELPPFLQGLPPEPLEPEFNSSYLKRVFSGRKRPIKSALLDNHLVTGLGNIYACEALFDAGIHPKTSAGKLSHKRCEILVSSIQLVIRAAIEAGGTSIFDFKSVDGSEGMFSRKLNVYGKGGNLCSRCHNADIRRIVLSGRSTFYCPRCQK
jgi:formamidopyrimidine-DNA glycosylase